MNVTARPYQHDMNNLTVSQFNSGIQNVLNILPTGTGKTFTFSILAWQLAIDPTGPRFPTAIGVHRKELLMQISLSLASLGIKHKFQASQETVSQILSAHQQLFRRQYFDVNSNITLFSVDTVKSREDFDHIKKFFTQIKFWIMDEAHHVVAGNKWGTTLAEFKNAYGCGWTAFPERLDGKGLGRKSGGLFDIMNVGPSTNWAINQGYLCDFVVHAPETYYRQELGQIKAGQEITYDQMRKAELNSKIIKDTVGRYEEHALGKQFIMFCGTMEGAKETLSNFHARGHSAVLLTAKTPSAERFKGIQDFKAGRIHGLLNIGLFDEGFDVPGVESVIHGAFTNSGSKNAQINGRVLRTVYAYGFDLETREGRLAAQAAGPKPYGIIIDLVGNLKFHGSPRRIRRFDLNGSRRSSGVRDLTRKCRNTRCNIDYERELAECPKCGTSAFDPDKIRDNNGRIEPEAVDGDLMMLDSKTLMEIEMMADINKFLESPISMEARVAKAAGAVAGRAQGNHQRERIETAHALKEMIMIWAGKMKHEGMSDRSIHMKFYMEFEKTMFHAVTESKAEMERTMRMLTW